MSKRKKKKSQAKKSAAAAAPDSEGAAPKTLAMLRKELDLIDGEIIAAINCRGAIAQKIGQLKQADGQGTYDVQRELQILQRAVANNAGPLSDEAVRAIFRELIS